MLFTPNFNPGTSSQLPNSKPRGLLGNISGNDLLALGQGLLSASGPSTRPIGLGEALGQGIGNFQQQRQQATEEERRQQQAELARQAHEQRVLQAQRQYELQKQALERQAERDSRAPYCFHKNSINPDGQWP